MKTRTFVPRNPNKPRVSSYGNFSLRRSPELMKKVIKAGVQAQEQGAISDTTHAANMKFALQRFGKEPVR